MSHDQPPGWTPPPPPGGPAAPSAGPTYGAPGQPGLPGQPPPGWGPGYAHKPGVVALRPLSLGDLYDGAFKTIRRNPKAMIGLAALVIAGVLVIPALATVGLAAAGQLGYSALEPGAGQVLTQVLQYTGSLFTALATVLLNGMIVQVVGQAVLGRRTTMGQAWAAVRGRIWRLIGLSLFDFLLVVLLLALPVAVGFAVGYGAGTGWGVLAGVLLGVVSFAVIVWVQVRWFLLAPAALVLERTTIGGAMTRAAVLSRGQWWRLFGIYLLTVIAVGIASSILGVPLGLIGVGSGFLVDDPTRAALILVFSGYVSQVVVGALTTPFTSAVTALLYVDQRIRKEALDVQLIAASQQPGH